MDPAPQPHLPKRHRALWESMRTSPAHTITGFIAGVALGLVVSLGLVGSNDPKGAASASKIKAASTEFCAIMTRAVATPVERDTMDPTPRQWMHGADLTPWSQPNPKSIVDIYSRILTDLHQLGITDSTAFDDLTRGLTAKRDLLRSEPMVYFSQDAAQINRQAQPRRLIGTAMFRLINQGLIKDTGECAALCSATASKGWRLLEYPFGINDQRRDAPLSGRIGDMLSNDPAGRAC